MSTRKTSRIALYGSGRLLDGTRRDRAVETVVGELEFGRRHLLDGDVLESELLDVLGDGVDPALRRLDAGHRPEQRRDAQQRPAVAGPDVEDLVGRAHVRDEVADSRLVVEMLFQTVLDRTVDDRQLAAALLRSIRS